MQTFLYETDKLWATKGDGFTSWYCPWLDKTISFGICMDINPDNFESPFTKFEYASHVVANASDLVLFACAWCESDPVDTTDTFPTLHYWAARLTPIIEALHRDAYPKDNCVFLCANRIGTENGTFFVGASCAMSLKEPKVLASAARQGETVLVVDLAN